MSLLATTGLAFSTKLAALMVGRMLRLNGVLCTCAGKLSFQITNKHSLNMVSMFLEGMSLPVSQHVCT